ncbi:pectate lyase-like adhesive domain-containing protein [uncultured Enterococcus sp.]|uniref:pectate lyase-like adhesive domain-containing protein n=1 Tax=uncultured Enterococcus sp. TaxID=167972 RepID=UPI002AA80409|nr:pectate lyase-like adhesive domain-containing protein [uncultured Enterococcus sp.]
MRIEKKNYVFGVIAVLFSILCVYFAMNTSLLKADEAVQGSYSFTGENLTEEAAFSGTIQVDSAKEETLKLEVSGENDGILYAENLQEALPAEYQEKVQFEDIEAGKSVAMTVKESGEALDIPVTIETELFAEASTRTLSLKKSDTVLETLELETTKDPEADVPAERTMTSLTSQIAPFALAGATEVTTWDQFVTALQDPSVSGIQLMNDISKGSSSAVPANNYSKCSN